jgi:hypothetical protein
MSTEPDDIPLARLKTMQIIAAAMMMGIVGALAIFLFLVTTQQKRPIVTELADLQAISIVALVLFATNAPLSLVLPGLVTTNSLRQLATSTSAVDRLLALRQTTLIIGLALVEGAAMLACIAFFLECHVLDLVVVGLALILMLARFPTRNRVRAWLAQQLAALEELQVRGGT